MSATFVGATREASASLASSESSSTCSSSSSSPTTSSRRSIVASPIFGRREPPAAAAAPPPLERPASTESEASSSKENQQQPAAAAAGSKPASAKSPTHSSSNGGIVRPSEFSPCLLLLYRSFSLHSRSRSGFTTSAVLDLGLSPHLLSSKTILIDGCAPGGVTHAGEISETSPCGKKSRLASDCDR